MTKLGNSYFLMADKNQTAPAPAQDTEVLQGQIEQSNVPVAESAVKLVGVMRQFEMLQKAITMGTEMNKQRDRRGREGQLKGATGNDQSLI